MPRYTVTQIIEAKNASEVAQRHPGASIERHYTCEEIAAYEDECNENGEIACVDPRHHTWAVSDEDENYCYCERCGTCDY